MGSFLTNRTSVALLACVSIVGPASAGGLAGAIVEDVPPVVAAAPATQGATNGWVIPLVALLAVGALAAGSGGSGGGSGSDTDGSGGTTPPSVGDVK